MSGCPVVGQSVASDCLWGKELRPALLNSVLLCQRFARASGTEKEDEPMYAPALDWDRLNLDRPGTR